MPRESTENAIQGSGRDPGSGVDVFESFDYRSLLRALYQARKRRQPGFSYRVLGARAGFASPSFFTKILKGESNVSPAMAGRLAEAFRLTRSEAEYFELLVLFNQAQTHADKKRYFERLAAIRRVKVGVLSTEQHRLFEEWYYVAIRELLAFVAVRGDGSELASLLRPSIRPAQARKALETLEGLGLARRNAQGAWERVDAVLTTGDEWRSEAIAGFQERMLGLARQALDRMETGERDITTLTLSVGTSDLLLIRERLARARREILEIARAQPRPDRVLQINMQVFPLSHPQENAL